MHLLALFLLAKTKPFASKQRAERFYSFALVDTPAHNTIMGCS